MIIREDAYPRDEILTTKQCAQAAGIDRRTVVEWIRKGVLPATRRPGARGHYRITWADLWDVLHTPAETPEAPEPVTG